VTLPPDPHLAPEPPPPAGDLPSPAVAPPATATPPATTPPAGPAELDTPAGAHADPATGTELDTPAGAHAYPATGTQLDTPAAIHTALTGADPVPAGHAAPATTDAAAAEPSGYLTASAAGEPAPPPAEPAGAPAAGFPPPGGHLPPPPPPQSRRQRFRAWRFAPVVEVLATVALALVLAEGVQAAVVKPFVIPSPSMEPTLDINQRVLVNRLAYDFGSPQRGDIVVFHPPNSQSCAVTVSNSEPCPRSVSTPASDYYVKRVIGLPGDRIAIRGGHPVINGHLLAHEPYIEPCGSAPECNMTRAIVIPKGEYFMMGDNRGDSDDSRFWGPVPERWIIGKVFATYWPPDRIGIF
jgi:signal peptidase I